MARAQWLDRRIAAPGPYLMLCLDRQEFELAMRHMRVRNVPEFVNHGADATTHQLEGPRGLTCVICMYGWQGRDPVEVAGLLVHEAVHVWQAYADRIGESSPGQEQEAYAIQSIAQELMAEFARRQEKT